MKLAAQISLLPDMPVSGPMAVEHTTTSVRLIFTTAGHATSLVMSPDDYASLAVLILTERDRLLH